jgi:hypothetical protein
MTTTLTPDIAKIDAVQRELENCATILGGHCLGIETAASAQPHGTTFWLADRLEALAAVLCVALGGQYFGSPLPEFGIVPTSSPE